VVVTPNCVICPCRNGDKRGRCGRADVQYGAKRTRRYGAVRGAISDHPRPGELRQAVIHLRLGDIESGDQNLHKKMGIDRAMDYVDVIRKGSPSAAMTIQVQSKRQSKVDKLRNAGALVSNGGGLREAIAIVAGANLLIGEASTFSWYLGIRTRAKVLAMTGANSENSAGNYSGGRI
jgi:hypothetical protein